MNIDSGESSSPFHQGEIDVQRRVGVAERMNDRGRGLIRTKMPDQHREFFSGLEYIFVGSSDQTGWPNPSVLFGSRGFVSSPDPQRLRIASLPHSFDLLSANLSVGASLGVLGIDLTNRRRNRINGTVVAIDESGFELAVVQSFGNCPQYIHTRNVRPTKNRTPDCIGPFKVETFELLDEDTRQFVGRASTFFVASCALNKDGTSFECDVSHRGGKSGFIDVADNQITVPDFAGNSFFNTLGNFSLNPKAGLIFVDFVTGDILSLLGTIELLWDDQSIGAFKGAQRAWRLQVFHGRKVQAAASRLIGELVEYSPKVLSTGTWQRSERST
ncbi:pyridoxamine 5'-phosphate oxidase family protein [Bradyrhizobium barranii]|uniref:Pyridoxamine 5'-phosphate oxidase family protein n=1 Tax=Bradyrhizobium barranii TaxID=2992140 RepID=A0ABY3QRE7_9BRAD|nr:pyridoxamine 5'-phosphate oxidase family protein [Bradyrhizobium japonicum]UFW88447.1 pyridoxamine 5'-phosphate oxidase family protein [Bradyrhizobium japonicum]